ncbi:hypothetical protein ACFL7M_15695 [Thermodesulfobacteriota bacterium]
MGDKKIIVFDPTPGKKRKQTEMASRPSDLRGKRLAVIWNGKLGGDILLNRFSELLTERLGLAGVERVDHRADTNTELGNEVVSQLAAICDTAIIGTGD